MAANTPLNSDTSTLPESSSAKLEPSSSAEHGLCLPYDEAVKELPVFLQPSDDQEQKDLGMFLSQVDELHKLVAGKLSARFVFNFVEHMLKPATPVTKRPTEIIVPEQLQELTKNIAFEEEGHEYYFYYGGENMEWIRSFTGMVGEVARELGVPINMVYVGSRSHNQELMRSVKEDNLSHCLSDEFYLWLFWKRLESIIHSGVYSGKYNDSPAFRKYLQDLQGLINYDKSNVGWAFLYTGGPIYYDAVWNGKVVVATLKEFKLWKEKALNEGFAYAFESHYDELYKKILPCKCLEFPTDALKQAPLETMECPDCENQMQKYTTFVCYHPSSTDKLERDE